MQNTSRKNNTALVLAALLAAGALLAANAGAQQSPSASPSSTSQSGSKTSKPASSSTSTKSTSTAGAKTASSPLPSEKDKNSYAVGANIGQQLYQQHLTPDMLDSPSFLRGLRDALQNKPLLLSQDEVKAAYDRIQDMMKEENLKEGQEFLAKNKSKEGVVTTPSGLQYKVLTTGTGPKPTAGDTVVCDYRGTLIDGKEFDSSYKRGQSATFPVSGVIKGWTEALQMMPVGSKWELYIPPDLAYGGRGAGPDIGPNSTLVFQVELHSIKGK
jgi:FKBP-type peptidyl-prolyl cis-trans isomerase FklB